MRITLMALALLFGAGSVACNAERMVRVDRPKPAPRQTVTEEGAYVGAALWMLACACGVASTSYLIRKDKRR